MSHSNKDSPDVLHVAFYPWFALGHLTPYLGLANKLAERGHKVSYFLPQKTQSKLASHNYYPHHITFVPIVVPFVDGLPPGAEITNDVPTSAHPLLMSAMHMTRNTVEAHLVRLKPNVVVYDFAYWMPELGRKHGFKSVHYIVTNISTYAHLAPCKNLLGPPPSFPTQMISMKANEGEVRAAAGNTSFGVTLARRIGASAKECDAFAVRASKEMEGPFCEYVEKIYGKPVLVAGPMVPIPPSSKLDEQFDGWLKAFEAGSVVYCALGSECTLELDQFQEILLGLELTGRPFLAVLKPPVNYETIESALPEGIEERIRGRGIIHGGWVQQQLILQHPSVGCFITHCGAGSLSKAMVSECQVVMMPQAFDQFVNARIMSVEWKVGVEVEKRENNGFFTKEAVHEAVSLVMEEESEVGKEVRANHAKWREFVLSEDLEDSYITSFIQSLSQLIG